MNNFDGQLSLYPEVCIDNFSSEIVYNIRIRCFILTHFHDDHMRSLEDMHFYRLLRENTELVKFYCSPITKKFIETCEKYKHLTEYCLEIACETPFVVKISPSETITATFCGSGHCPGSVMVFLEGSRGNVLFTGDFRLPLYCASRLMFFKENHISNETLVSDKVQTTHAIQNERKIKEVTNLYVDMTFFKPEIRYIPTREESVEALVKFITNFLSSNKPANKNVEKSYFENCIYMKTSARIGYEYVYQEIYRSTGHKTHVNDLIYTIYEQMPMVQACLTKDPYETPIHACIYENKKRDAAKTDLMCSPLSKTSKPYSAPISKNFHKINQILPCTLNKENEHEYYRANKINAVKVILSAMWFTDTAGVDQIFIEYKPPKKDFLTPAFKPFKTIYRLCYSFHSSFEEIVDFVNTIKPKKLFSIALPESTTEKMINQYFYNPLGNFKGFHLNESRNSTGVVKNGLRKTDNLEDRLELVSTKKLVLRKRKSYETLRDSSSDRSTNSSRDSLNFGEESSEEEKSAKKKLKS